ncbi:MAG: hypothetical protein DWQ02_24905 [Bacteroidetes bacterium]|nr:MAG: hypothetical protein DWQ02_24905 [Bacteroidota bacterium]
MFLSNPIIDFYILLTWFIIGLVAYLLKRRYKFFQKFDQSNWIILGIVGLFILLRKLWYILIQTVSGIIYEELAFMDRMYGGWFLLILALQFVIPILFTLNLINKVRNNSSVRIFQTILIILILVGGVLILDNFSTIIFYGWHTVLFKSNFSLIFILTGSILFILNMVVIRFKLK